jgi:predicted amidohydrolase YtcJ
MDADASHRPVMKLISSESVVTADGRVGNAIVVHGGRVVHVGDRQELVRSHMVEERYPGSFIIPGLRDAHIHVVPYAALMSGCSLKSATSMDDLIERLADFAGRRPEDASVVATRFDDESLVERRLPTRVELDRAVPDRPAVIYRYCGHIAVANSMALAASGITEHTADPEGGSIDRDDIGLPTGVLRETAAGLIGPALSRGGTLDPDALISALEGLASIGITSVGAMIGYGESPSEKLEAEIELWRTVARRLPIRVHGIVITDDADRLEWAADALSNSGPRLRWLGVKRFADGSLGGHTAAMREPFADVDSLGTFRLTAADEAIARRSVEMGGVAAIHAIGDRAVSGVLDTFERLIAVGADPTALRMEHVSIIDPPLAERFAQLGVTAVIQPAFLASESQWVFDRVGPDREAWVYPFRSMSELGIPMAGSSDCPVEPPHPLWGMAAAIDRYGITPDEALDPLAALGLFTVGGARTLREPPPLAVGSPADLIVVDVDPSTATADSIHDAIVLDTYVDGEVVDVDRSLSTWVD